MADENSSGKWRRFHKLHFSSKGVSKRVRKAETATVRHARRFIVKRWSNIREVRRIIAFWAIAVGCLIGAAGIQLLWNQREYTTQASALGGTYAEAVIGPEDTLNPLFASTPAEESASRLLFSRLLSYDTTGNLNNDLAQSVHVDGAGVLYTVKIRSDALWHDGARVTADDVVFTVGLIRDPATRSVISGWDDITVKKIDNTTVQFSLPTPYAAFRHALTFPILPSHILRDIQPAELRENQFSSTPVGSGPMQLRLVQDVDVSSNRKIVHLATNSQYYKGSAKLEKLQLHVYPDREAILQALQVGEVNAASGLSSNDLHSVNTHQYTISTRPIQSGVYALFNTESVFLQDVAVRRALQVGTDTTEIRKKLDNGAPALELPFTNGQLSGEVPTAPTYDVAKANKLLDDAGWTIDKGVRKKDGVELRLSVVTTKDSDYERVIETLSGQWSKLSIAVDVRIIDASDPSQNFIQAVLQPRNFDVLVYQLEIGRDPDVFVYWHSSQATARGRNFSNYTNALSDDALASARARVEPALRNAKYITFSKQWLSDAPAIGLYQSVSNYVHSYGTDAEADTTVLVTPQDRYSSVLYWTAGQRTVYKTP